MNPLSVFIRHRRCVRIGLTKGYRGENSNLYSANFYFASYLSSAWNSFEEDNFVFVVVVGTDYSNLRSYAFFALSVLIKGIG
ncbi:hypothetical protein J2Z66_001369 [Paenibacillus eucommiae]|uniref:Uncharacterized protein n=1 Tax=Paenibacillus eucommiae TaxID=1355755 RepID=A0ABS4ISA9_9BACL|nr:hypothetical protein [Paenibacillus eucommiae]